MEKVLKATVINTEDIIALEGEEVVFDWPDYSILPVGVLDRDGNLLGYLGRNDATCVPGSTTGQAICEMVEKGWVVKQIKVTGTTYYRTHNRKLIVEASLTKVEEYVVV